MSNLEHRQMKTESVSKIVRLIIDRDITLQDALSKGYGNLSAIARMIKPEVEANLMRSVKAQSVITAVKRIRILHIDFYEKIGRVIAKSVVNVRTDVAKLSVEKTKRSLEIIRTILADYQEEFLQVSESMSAITLIFDQKLFDEIGPVFRKNELLEERLSLAAIIIHSPIEIVETPGCVVAFYNQLSRRNVNIQETTSCFTDTIMVVRMEDVGPAFIALTDLIHEARRFPQKVGNIVQKKVKSSHEELF